MITVLLPLSLFFHLLPRLADSGGYEISLLQVSFRAAPVGWLSVCCGSL